MGERPDGVCISRWHVGGVRRRIAASSLVALLLARLLWRAALRLYTSAGG